MPRCDSSVLPDFIAPTSILLDITKFLVLFKTVIQSHDFESNSQNKALNCKYASLTPRECKILSSSRVP